VLAVDGHRMLFAAMPGVDGFDASESEFKRMIKALVELQLASVTGVDELVQLGVPDCRGEQLLQPLSDLVHRLAPHSLPLQRLVEELPQRLHIANNAGFPDTLVHGDAHCGNCRLGSAQPIWFDWGDSFVGHPLYDLATIESSHPVVLEAWLKVWAEKLPASDPHTAWAALAPVAKLRKAFVYQQFYTVAYSTIHPA